LEQELQNHKLWKEEEGATRIICWRGRGRGITTIRTVLTMTAG
jgi:hypothetical protein